MVVNDWNSGFSYERAGWGTDTKLGVGDEIKRRRCKLAGDSWEQHRKVGERSKNSDHRSPRGLKLPVVKLAWKEEILLFWES